MARPQAGLTKVLSQRKSVNALITDLSPLAPQERVARCMNDINSSCAPLRVLLLSFPDYAVENLKRFQCQSRHLKCALCPEEITCVLFPF